MNKWIYVTKKSFGFLFLVVNEIFFPELSRFSLQVAPKEASFRTLDLNLMEYLKSYHF